jgi:bifunctional pyridoxal-dependent enzyme with beta-cystathionase and maltose regulon repressor activities
MTVDVKVKISVGKGKEVVLDNADAKELYEALKAMYDHPVITYPTVIEKIVERDVWPWRSPSWIPDTRPNTVTYCNGSVSATARVVK